MTSLLAIDASKFVGWAHFASPTAMPKCRTWVAQELWNSDEYAAYFLEFEEWLNGMLSLLQPDVFAFESPIVVATGGWGDDRGSDGNNIRRLIGIVSVAELLCPPRQL